MEVFPVVHINDEAIAKTQAEIAIREGADGVYLIDHHRHTPDRLFRVCSMLEHNFPKPFIGINILGLKPSQQINQCRRFLDNGLIDYAPSAVWSDFRDDTVDPDLKDDKRLKNILTLGAASFKHIDETEDPEISAELARRAAMVSDIVVTSGPATGYPPSAEKIKAMKDAVETLTGKKLAIASGVSPYNIAELSAADQVLVSTSIETNKGSGIFNLDELRKMIEIAHSL